VAAVLVILKAAAAELVVCVQQSAQLAAVDHLKLLYLLQQLVTQ
jgi:hypothetical protein